MKKLPVILGSIVALMVIYVGALSFSLSADVKELESLVLPHIRNIESAKFSAPVFAKNNSIACMEWNSTDASGGYESWKMASFSKTGSGWVLNELESSSCGQSLKDSNTEKAAY
jgi:hypothetical protein